MVDLQGGSLALEHRYDILKRTGSVTFVSIYDAIKEPFQIPVWVKVFEHELSMEMISRIRDAATTLQDLQELDLPGLTRIVDFGELSSGQPFVVSSKVDGLSLFDYVDARGTLTLEEVLAFLGPIARALDALAEKDAVHGAIAPCWIYLVDDSIHRPVLDHAGLSLRLPEIKEIEGALLSWDLVFPMAPEIVVHDEHPDRRSDLWALGAVVYWALSGVHPYLEDMGDTSDGLLAMRSRDVSPLAKFGVDEEISDIVSTALERDPGLRYRSAQEFFEALEAAVQGKRPTQDQESDRQQRSVPVERAEAPPEHAYPGQQVIDPPPLGSLFVLALLLLIFTNILWFLFSMKTPSEPQTITEAAPALSQLLPMGIELHAEPPRATLTQITAAGESDFGDLPIVLNPRAVEEESLRLRISHHGHHDVRIDIRESEDGHDLIVHLPDDGSTEE